MPGSVFISSCALFHALVYLLLVLDFKTICKVSIWFLLLDREKVWMVRRSAVYLGSNVSLLDSYDLSLENSVRFDAHFNRFYWPLKIRVIPVNVYRVRSLPPFLISVHSLVYQSRSIFSSLSYLFSSHKFPSSPRPRIFSQTEHTVSIHLTLIIAFPIISCGPAMSHQSPPPTSNGTQASLPQAGDLSDDSDDYEFPDVQKIWARAKRHKQLRLSEAAKRARDSTKPPEQQPATTTVPTDSTDEEDNDDNNLEEQERDLYTVEKIVDWRFEATASKTRPAPSTGIPRIELLIHWEGYPEPTSDTWEDEATTQLTAGEQVWTFWDTLARAQGIGRGQSHRNAILGIDSYPDTEYLVLRISGHRKRRAKGRGSSIQGSFQFLVEWVGYRVKTWEPESNLDADLVEEYWQSLKPEADSPALAV